MSDRTDNDTLRQADTFRALITEGKGGAIARERLASVAAAHLNPERMLRMIALSASRNPKLMECTPLSILGAVMSSAAIGLEPNTPFGHSYLVPFARYGRPENKGERPRKIATEAQLVIGYRGYLQLGHNSQMIASFDGAIHYSTDPVWKWRRGSNPILEHETGPETGEMLHAYAVTEIKGGSTIWVCWPEAKLVAHRDRYSKGYAYDVKDGKKPTDPNVNIWLGQPDIARIKTMFRQLAKFMPMATEIPRAALLDGSSANFSAFALDPSMGLPAPETSSENEIEGTVEDDGGPESGQDDAGGASDGSEQETVTPGPDGAAALSEARERAKAATTGRKTAAATPKPAAPAAPAVPDEARLAELRSMVDMIVREITDMPTGRGHEAADLWTKQLDAMKVEAPDLYNEVQDALAQHDDSGRE